jgi:hypothetical protein
MEFDGKVLVVKNFLTEEERLGLYNWAVDSAAKRESFVNGISYSERVETRVTTRIAENINYPEIAYTIKNKVQSFMTGLDKCPIIDKGHGKDGLVVSVTYDGGDVYPHVDPKTPEMDGGLPLCGLRCNILVSAPDSGGTIHIDNKEFNLDSGDLHCYLVTEYHHSVDVCHGTTPRVLFMYGWVVSKNDWESGKHLPKTQS